MLFRSRLLERLVPVDDVLDLGVDVLDAERDAVEAVRAQRLEMGRRRAARVHLNGALEAFAGPHGAEDRLEQAQQKRPALVIQVHDDVAKVHSRAFALETHNGQRSLVFADSDPIVLYVVGNGVGWSSMMAYDVTHQTAIGVVVRIFAGHTVTSDELLAKGADALAAKVAQLEEEARNEERKLRKMERQARIEKAHQDYLECLEALASSVVKDKASELMDEKLLKKNG